MLGVLILGLWRVTEWARLSLTVIVLAGAVVVPVGIINPFAAMDWINPPTVWELAVQVYVPCLVAVVYVFALGRFKGEFRRQAW